MTLMYAAVKYPANATNDEKIKALREGLDDIVVALIDEFEVPLADVEDWLNNAANTAEWTDQERRYREEAT